MEILKKTILLEDNIDRTNNSPTWGTLTATTFYMNIMLTQSMDNMGIFSDMEFFPKTDTSPPPDYTILIDKLTNLNISFPFMGGAQPIFNPFSLTEQEILRLPNKPINEYYNYLNLKISGYTDSKIEELRSYAESNPFRIGFDVETSDYYNYVNSLINGVSRIKTMAEPRIYVFDTTNDVNLGTQNQTTGLQYIEYTGLTRNVTLNGVDAIIPITEFYYIGEGFNETNTSLSALTKEEYLFGIIFPPEVKSEVFIERGITPVTDKHLRLSEVKNLNELTRYGNGYYTINKQ